MSCCCALSPSPRPRCCVLYPPPLLCQLRTFSAHHRHGVSGGGTHAFHASGPVDAASWQRVAEEALAHAAAAETNCDKFRAAGTEELLAMRARVAQDIERHDRERALAVQQAADLQRQVAALEEATRAAGIAV